MATSQERRHPSSRQRWKGPSYARFSDRARLAAESSEP
jgi:hypothetical protein